MRPTLRKLLRAVVIGLVLGGILFWWMRQKAEMKRIDEVRRRVSPHLADELHTRGFALGDPIYIRVLKETLEAEIWIRAKRDDRFNLWKTYPIAAMSGKLGPKLAEGDRQAPEGFYEVDASALNPNSDFHLSFNLGYPNEFDRNQGRTGSWIMMHGGRVSVGCFAMTDPAIEEIYLLAEAALQRGQKSFAVHVFPFRMTDERMRAAADSRWLSFWENLRQGYEKFEETHLPPTVRAESDHYVY